MKILKYGEGYPKTVVCDECKSTLEYVYNDIRDTSTTITCGDPKIKYIKYDLRVLDCPVCDHSIIIESACREIHYNEQYVQHESDKPNKRWWQV